MNLEEIKKAVTEGKKVHWVTEAYIVINPKGGSQWLIKCELNNSCIGLTWADGKTMNGKESEFYIGQDESKGIKFLYLVSY